MTNHDIENAIDVAMREYGVGRDEAEVIVAMTRGESNGDLLSMRPLTSDQRQRRLRTLRETMFALGELSDDLNESPSTHSGQADTLSRRAG